MVKIYFGKRLLILTRDTEFATMHVDFSAIYKYSTPNELQQFVAKFRHREDLMIGCVYYHDMEVLFQEVKKIFRNISAAGGLVVNGEGRYLVIVRNGIVDLPKGKAESGESVQQTALREVEEETGVAGLEISTPLCETYHTYELNEDVVLKRTYWFMMRVNGVPTTTPQAVENITETRWVTEAELVELARESYPSVKDVVSSALNVEIV